MEMERDTTGSGLDAGLGRWWVKSVPRLLALDGGAGEGPGRSLGSSCFHTPPLLPLHAANIEAVPLCNTFYPRLPVLCALSS